jgi:putative ABC transport system permease protein
MCSFAIRKNIIKAYEQHIGKYAAVAIVTENGFFSEPMHSLERVNIDDDFIKSFIMSEYIFDYYAFNQRPAGSNTLKSIPSILSDEWSDWIIRDEGNTPFDLIIYSDISKSTHFRIGDRKIIDGRFAENTDECNVSNELANLNGLAVGDYIEIFIFYRNPQYFNLKIVGIYEDNTNEIINELVLVTPKIFNSLTNEAGIREGHFTSASKNNISFNQILTVSPSSKDLITFSVLNIDLGYDALVYYTHDEMSIINYVNKLEDLLPEQFVTLDSGETLRTVLFIFEETENSFTWFLIIVNIASIIFCILIVFYILKDRTYDIGVFRTRGMSRIKTSVLISSEVFIVLLFAFIIAWVLYINTFINIVGYIYNIQAISMINESFVTGNYKGHVLDNFAYSAARNHAFFLSADLFDLFFIFLIIITFAVIVSFFAVLFISRHEPMKTMTEH